MEELFLCNFFCQSSGRHFLAFSFGFSLLLSGVSFYLIEQFSFKAISSIFTASNNCQRAKWPFWEAAALWSCTHELQGEIIWI